MKKYLWISGLVIVIGMIGCSNSLPVLETNAIPNSGSLASFASLVKSDNVSIDSNVDDVMIYRTSPVVVSGEEIINLANYMGIKEYKMTNNDREFAVTDGAGNSVSLLKDSGSIFCNFAAQYNNDKEFEGTRLTDQQYEKLAYDWIVSAGLFSDLYQNTGSVVENRLITKLDESGNEYSYPTMVTVKFEYKPLNGIEVSGVAPRILVDLDMNGEIVSAAKIQRQFSKYMNYPIIGIDEAFNQIVKGDGTIYNAHELNLIGTVNKVKLAYYNMEVMVNTQYLLPVYIINGSCEDGEFTAVTYAVDHEHLKMIEPVVTDSSDSEDSGPPKEK